MELKFRLDDLTGEQTRVLIARHLAGMRANSPAESVHALEIDKLRSPDITFWSVWTNDQVAGCGALKTLDARRGELKSMRVADAFLGKGMKSLWLETGSSPAFAPALRLFMTRAI